MNKILILLLAALATTSASATCTPKVDGAEMAKAWAEKRPISGLDDELSMTDAECIRASFQQALVKQAGAVVGYKVGLTNPKVQKALGHDAPLGGELMANMLLPSPAVVAVGFGTRPLMEADLLVEVADDGINAATTPAEVMQHLAGIKPFIELPDLLIDPQVPLNGVRMTAINVGARLGIVGPTLPAAPELTEYLASTTVVLSDGSGKTLTQGQGSDILGHPLNAMIWLVKDLAKQGKRLRKGDLVSLGSFNPPLKPEAGQEITVSYPGVPGMQGATVRFE